MVFNITFNATFNKISVIYQFYWWREQEDPEKTTDLSQVTDKLYHIVIEIRTHNISGDEADCIGGCKSNYHTIMATTAPGFDCIFTISIF